MTAQLLAVFNCQLGTASLVNSFPFTDSARPRDTKQSNDAALVDFNSVAAASAAGKRCIDKVV